MVLSLRLHVLVLSPAVKTLLNTRILTLLGNALLLANNYLKTDGKYLIFKNGESILKKAFFKRHVDAKLTRKYKRNHSFSQ